MRVAFRVDGSQEIGTGHVRRCLSLAQALQDEGIQTLFVCRRLDEASELPQLGEQSVAWLPAPSGDFTPSTQDPTHAAWACIGWEEDAQQTTEVLAGLELDWLIVDHYAFDQRWHRAVSTALALKHLAVIDDLGDRPLAADLLIDHNLDINHQAKYAAVLQGAKAMLTGPRYALLSKAYAEAAPYSFREQVASIGIFMGGVDPGGMSAEALRGCRETAGFIGEIEIVSSPRSPYHLALKALAAKWPRTRVVADLPDLSSFFARHDIQIGAGGGASWERCCMGAPTVACSLAANQDVVLSALQRLGVVEVVADTIPASRAFGHAVLSLMGDADRRRAMAATARTLVDGAGSARVAGVLAVAATRQFAMREVQPRDEDQLLEWANDPRARRHAFQSAPIDAASHARWFAARLARPASCRMLIAETRAGVPFGLVRFELHDGQWEISYSLDPAFRGWGLGRPLLAQALRRLAATAPGASAIGFVKLDNVASLRTFRSLGFQENAAERAGAACSVFFLTLANADG